MPSLPVVSPAPACPPSPCARCARDNDSCCNPLEGVELAFLTPGDVDRIHRSTGLPVDLFAEPRPLSPADARELARDDTDLRRLAEAWHEAGWPSVMGLRRTDTLSGPCVLLGSEGCRLDSETRPLLCRRYPFVRSRRGWELRPGGRCVGVDESRNWDEALQAFSTSLRALQALSRQLRAELGGSATAPRPRTRD